MSPQELGAPLTERLDRLDLGLAVLALGAGTMDAFGFLALGGALPSAMTGNTALLGLAVGQGRWADAAPPVAAFVGFLAGAAAAAILRRKRLADVAPHRSVAGLLTVEAGLLVAFLVLWQFVDQPAERWSLYVVIVIVAAGMGVQSVAARQDRRPGVTTVVFTSTLTSIVLSATDAMLGSPHRLDFAAKRQLFMFLAYGLGAVAGGVLTPHASGAVPLVPLIATLGAVGLHRTWSSVR